MKTPSSQRSQTPSLWARCRALLARCCRGLLATCWDGSTRALPLSSESRFVIASKCLLPCLLLLGMAGLVTRSLWTIQFTDHEKHLAAADRLLGLRQTVLGTRGDILDRDGNLLVGNIRTRDLYATPQHVLDQDPELLEPFTHFLAEQTRQPVHAIATRVRKTLRREFSITILDEATEEDLLKVRALRIPGVSSHRKDNAEKLFTIEMQPRELGEEDLMRDAARRLEDTLALPAGEIQARLERALRRKIPFVVAKHLSLEDAARIEANFREWARDPNSRSLQYLVPTNSIHFEESTQRFYPKRHLLANTLGFCGADSQGLSGVERLMDKRLRGRTVHRSIVLDGKINPATFQKNIYDPELDGASVHLTIQLPIQQIVEDGLAELVELNRPKRAYALMMDPKTGAILALAQYPNFDFNDKSTITPENREFHALYSGYEPGSIMKAISVSSAIDYGHLSVDTQFDCENGSWVYGGGRPLREHGNVRFDLLSLKEIIQKSSNIGSAKAVIDTMDAKNFYHYLIAFGLGQKTRVGFYPEDGEPLWFHNESPGMLASVERWRKIDVSRICIGHSVMVTPFQMVQAYCAIANGGLMMQPYLIDRVVEMDGTVTSSVPRTKSRPISPETARKITECLMTVVQKGGTATSAAVPGYHVAGKTGTAIKAVKDPATGKVYYDRRKNTASFTGFVPAEDPAFVLLITADEPSGKYQYGGSVCGKTFSQIALQTLKIMQIPPLPEEFSEGMAAVSARNP